MVERELARMKIATRVRRGRQVLRLTQLAAAKRARIGRVTWLRYESGEKSIPSEVLPRIANAIELPVHTVLGVAA